MCRDASIINLFPQGLSSSDGEEKDNMSWKLSLSIEGLAKIYHGDLGVSVDGGHGRIEIHIRQTTECNPYNTTQTMSTGNQRHIELTYIYIIYVCDVTLLFHQGGREGGRGSGGGRKGGRY